MHFMNTPQWSDILIQIRVLYAILRITYLFHGILIWFPILYILFWRMLWTWSSLMTIRDGLAALTCWRGYGCHRRRETESGCLLKPPTGQVPHFVSHEPVKRLLWWIPHQKLRERFCLNMYRKLQLLQYSSSAKGRLLFGWHVSFTSCKTCSLHSAQKQSVESPSSAKSPVPYLFATLAVRDLKAVIRHQLTERFPKSKATAVRAGASSGRWGL